MPKTKKKRETNSFTDNITVDKNWEGFDPFHGPFLQKKAERAAETLEKYPIPDWIINYKKKK